VVSLITDARGQTIFSVLAICVIIMFGSTRHLLRPYDGMDLQVGDGAVKVAAVCSGGLAENAGILAGDQSLAIGSQPADGWASSPPYLYGVRPVSLRT